MREADESHGTADSLKHLHTSNPYGHPTLPGKSASFSAAQSMGFVGMHYSNLQRGSGFLEADSHPSSREESVHSDDPSRKGYSMFTQHDRERELSAKSSYSPGQYYNPSNHYGDDEQSTRGFGYDS
jgi:hypothetical protein